MLGDSKIDFEFVRTGVPQPRKEMLGDSKIDFEFVRTGVPQPRKEMLGDSKIDFEFVRTGVPQPHKEVLGDSKIDFEFVRTGVPQPPKDIPRNQDLRPCKDAPTTNSNQFTRPAPQHQLVGQLWPRPAVGCQSLGSWVH